MQALGLRLKLSAETVKEMWWWIAIVAMLSAYALMLYAAYLLHPAALVAMIGVEVYLFSGMAFQLYQAQFRRLLEAQARQEMEKIMAEQGGDDRVLGGALHPRARGAMH